MVRWLRLTKYLRNSSSGSLSKKKTLCWRDGKLGKSLQSTPTAREMSKMTMLREMDIWIMTKILAQRASNGASVGPKVELWVKAMKR